MLKLITFNYTVMLNFCQYCLKKCTSVPVLVSMILAFIHKKMPLQQNVKYTVLSFKLFNRGF